MERSWSQGKFGRVETFMYQYSPQAADVQECQLKKINELFMQNDGEDGEKPTDVGLRIQRSISLGAVRF